MELGKAQKHIVTTAVVQAPAPAPVAAAHAAAAHTAVMPPPAPTPVAAVSTTPRRSARAPAPNTSIPAPVAANDNSFIDESPAALPRPSTRSSIASSTTTEKSVRFQAANNVIVEEPANNNKPLPVYSFLSSNQPAERIPGTAPKVRMLSSSAARRCSTAATPSTSGAVRLTKGDFSIAATVTSKENEVNAPALSAAPIRASKRDSTLDFSTATKRIKVDDTPSQWNLGSNTGFAAQNSRRTSTWR